MMRLLIFLLSLFLVPTVVFGQKIIEELSDFYTPELILENNIHEVIIEVKDTPSQKLTFNHSGLILRETEFKNWATGDTTIKYYSYSNNLRMQVVHVDVVTGDTFSYDNYIYEDGVLIGKEGIQSTNNTKTNFQYYDNGNLKESLMVMTFSIGGDTSRLDHKFYDELGRKIRFERTLHNGAFEVTYYIYNERSIDFKRENEVTKELYIQTTAEFNEQLQFIKITKYKSGTSEIKDVLIIKYTETGLMEEMKGRGNMLVKFSYSFY